MLLYKLKKHGTKAPALLQADLALTSKLSGTWGTAMLEALHRARTVDGAKGRVLQAPDALLGWQVAFVEELHGAGVVDDVERKSLLAPIEKRERMLQRRGAVWRTPRVMDVRPVLCLHSIADINVRLHSLCIMVSPLCQ